MINKKDLDVLMEQQPFTPFRLHFSNGATHDVTHPEGLMVRDRVAAIAKGDSIWLVAMGHIVEVEPLATIKF